uniref:Uncharacterized protein n=1 Tax=Knipowitschia caucasica TaxID=637954 RepID=A0AAV2M6D1_KNICA
MDTDGERARCGAPRGKGREAENVRKVSQRIRRSSPSHHFPGCIPRDATPPAAPATLYIDLNGTGPLPRCQLYARVSDVIFVPERRPQPSACVCAAARLRTGRDQFEERTHTSGTVGQITEKSQRGANRNPYCSDWM